MQVTIYQIEIGYKLRLQEFSTCEFQRFNVFEIKPHDEFCQFNEFQFNHQSI